MSTRAGFTIIEKGTTADFSRHWDGYPEGVAGDLESVEVFTAGSIIKALHLETSVESGLDYLYDIDLDKGEISVFDCDWRTDTKTDLIFKGSFQEFIENFNKG